MPEITQEQLSAVRGMSSHRNPRIEALLTEFVLKGGAEQLADAFIKVWAQRDAAMNSLCVVQGKPEVERAALHAKMDEPVIYALTRGMGF